MLGMGPLHNLSPNEPYADEHPIIWQKARLFSGAKLAIFVSHGRSSAVMKGVLLDTLVTIS
jgi:hypothetical protein